MDFSMISTVISITVLAYLAGMVCKAVPAVKDEWIPVIVGVIGCALGVAGMYVIQDFPAANVLDAMAVGVASGLAATGVHQAWSQHTSD